MNLLWDERAWADYIYWQGEDKRTLKRINLLLKDMERNVFDGIGEPEPLKHEMSGWWSRRIDEFNRIVYKLDGETIIIAACKGHYGDR